MKVANSKWLPAISAVMAAGLISAGQSGIAAASPAARTSPAAPRAEALPAYTPSGRILRLGMRGTAVENLQRRLDVLKYYPGKIDGIFGQNTLEAAWAYERVQGFTIDAQNANTVSRTVQRTMLNPRLPRVLVPRGGSRRVEINLRKEVLVLYNHNQIEMISHVSTGGGYYYPCPGGGTCGPAITPTGNYRFLSYAPGWIQVPLGTMYNSAFFIGRAYAVHGDIPVPYYPASHGCVRIPMDIAGFFHKKIQFGGAGVGTPLYIRHG